MSLLPLARDPLLKLLLGVSKTFVFELWVVAEIDQQTELEARRAEVIQQLRPMLVGEGRDCFDFNDDLIVADEVRLIDLPESSAAIAQMQHSNSISKHS
jgi:hypothetical protein